MNNQDKSIKNFGSYKQSYASFSSINANKQNNHKYPEYSATHHYHFDISIQEPNLSPQDRRLSKLRSILLDTSIPGSSQSSKKTPVQFNPTQSNLKMDKFNRALNYTRFKNSQQIGYNGVQCAETKSQIRNELSKNKTIFFKHKSQHQHQKVQKKQRQGRIQISGTGYLELSYQAYRIWKNKGQTEKKGRENQLLIKCNYKQAQTSKVSTEVKYTKIKKNSLLNEQKIKNVFGKYHSLLKNGNDYLTKSSISNLHRLGIPYNLQSDKQPLSQQTNNKANIIEKKCRIQNKMENKPELSFHKAEKLEQMKIQAPLETYLKKLPPFTGKCDIEQMDQQKLENERLDTIKIFEINDQKVQWMTIPQISSWLITKKRKKQTLDKQIKLRQQQFKLKKARQSLPLFDGLVLTNFLKFLWLLEKDILIRVVSGFTDCAFIVWLFIDGYFSPIYVDNLFPVNIQLLPFQDCEDINAYILIITKAICKIKKSYQFKVLERVGVEQTYRMLTGLYAKQLKGDFLKQVSTIQLKKWIDNEQKDRKKYFCLEKDLFYFISTPFASSYDYYNEQQQANEYINEKKGKKILLIDTQGKSIKELLPHDKYKYQLFILDSFYSWFFYTFQLPKQHISKLTLATHQQILFRFTTCFDYRPKQEITAYLYRVQKQGEGGKKVLRLIKTLRNWENLQVNLRAGEYIIFVQSKIGLLPQMFREKSKGIREKDAEPKKGQMLQQNQIEEKESKSYYLNVLTSTEVGITYYGQLNKCENFVEDQQNIYVQMQEKNPMFSCSPS